MASRPAPPDADDLIAVGVLRRAHGVRGEISTESLTSSLERFAELDEVWLVSPDRTELRAARVTAFRPHKDRALLKLDLIAQPEEVRPFQNWTIEVTEDEARDLEEDEFFLHDLEGLEVLDPEGVRIGRVAEVQETGAGILLAIEDENGRFDVPFVKAICTVVDVEGGRMVADLPEGLRDLDRVTAVEEDSELADAVAAETRQMAEERNEEAALTVDVVTIFPAMFQPVLSEGVVARAAKQNVLDVKVHDLRDYAVDRHRSTDDEAYGGGAGMVMLAEPIGRCIDSISESRGSKPWTVLLSPQGRPFDHSVASALAGRGSLLLVCGRYEGIDERVREMFVDEEVSIGDFVVSGGEIPAMLVLDAVARLIDGVVGQRNSVEADSFYNGLLDYPHYTRPAEWRGARVPEVLLSGHAEKIRKWRREQSLRATLAKRPDLLDSAPLDDEARAILRAIGEEASGGD